MKHADQMLEHWLNDPNPVESPEVLAKSIDPRVRVDDFLYNERQRFIFSDRSQVLYENGRLKVVRN